jgi:signal transduction histidine kinase
MAAVFYLVERRTDMTEVSEHVVIAAVFTGATATLAIVLLGTFTRLRNRFLQRERRLRALYDASTSLVVEAAGRPAIRAVVGRAAEIVAADRVVLVPEDGFLGVAPQIGETLPGESDIAASAKRVSRPQRTHLGSRPTVAVPVRRDGEVVGVLVASRHEGAGFSDEDVLLLQMFSAALSAGLVVHERLEHAQLLATVEERERVARELHDNLGQLLGFITAKVQAAQALLDRGRHEAAATEMTDLEQAARTLSGDVREAILALRARVGPRRPVAVALADYVRDFSIQTGITVEVQASAIAGGSLAGSSQYQVLRIAQEALSNVRRHPGTATARVVLAESGGRLELAIADDGTGFDASRIESGFGLRGMAERAHSLQGTLDVCSVPGQGTTVSLDVPLHPWEVSSDGTPSGR